MTEKNRQKAAAIELSDEQLNDATGGTEPAAIKSLRCLGCGRSFEYHAGETVCPFCGGTRFEVEDAFLMVHPLP